MRTYSFFSSRRRHTRYWRDWSSAVCSSDRAEARRLRAAGRRVVVVVLRLDRLGRRILERVRCREELKTLGVPVHSVREGGEVSDLVANILASVAEEETRALGERVSVSKQHAIALGWFPPGQPPWGYRWRAATSEERAGGATKVALEAHPDGASHATEALARHPDGAPAGAVPKQHPSALGCVPPGQPPWGYRWRAAPSEERAGGAPKVVLEAHPDEASHATEALARHADGASAREVHRWVAGLPKRARGDG